MDNRKTTVLIFISAMILFLAGLYSQEFIRINSRYAIFAIEMRKYGVHLFPTLYGKPYLDYLSPYIFLTYLTSFGGKYVNMLTLTFPSAVAASLTLVMTYGIGLQISKKLGFYAVFICLMTYLFVACARAPSMDMFVTFFATASFYLVYTADKNHGWQRLLLVPLCFVASFSIRGLLGIIIPGAVVFVYYCVNRKWKMAAVSAAVTAFIILVCMTLVLYLCVYSGGRKLPELFLQNQIFSRIGNHKPPWFFIIRGLYSYVVAFPMALLVIVFYAKKLIRKPSDLDSNELYLMRGLTAWLLIVLIGMSIPGDKHLRYILPIIPASALLGSWIFINSDKIALFDKIRIIMLRLCRIAPFAALLVAIAGIATIEICSLTVPQLPIFLSMFFYLALCALVWKSSKYVKLEYRDLTFVGIMAAVMMVLQITVIGPVEEYMESSRQFVADVEHIRNDRQVYFFNLGPDGDELKYLVNLPSEKMFIPKFIFAQGKYVPKAKLQPAEPMTGQPGKLKGLKGRIVNAFLDVFPNNKSKTFPPLYPAYICYPGYDNLLCLPEGTLFITRASRFKRTMPDILKAKFEIVAKGKLGHKQCVAFRMKKNQP